MGLDGFAVRCDHPCRLPRRGAYALIGVLNSPAQIGFEGDQSIDLLPPDYDLVDPDLYAVNETYYGYTSRGCVSSCPWCGVPSTTTLHILLFVSHGWPAS